MTFSFVESSGSQLDNKSMAQTLDASPLKPDISDYSDFEDLHVVSGTREIPSGDQSSSGVRQAILFLLQVAVLHLRKIRVISTIIL